MDSSENQFQELVAQIVARVNKSLLEKKHFLPIAIYLRPSGEFGVVTTLEELSEKVSDHVDFLQDDLRKKVRNEQVLATCVAYPDYENQVVIAFLENAKNYCSKITIPVLIDDSQRLDIDGIEIADSNIYIFPVIQ